MLNINYNLRDPNTDNLTSIIMVIRYANQKIVISIKEKVHPKNWDGKNQKMKNLRNLFESPEFNARLMELKSIVNKEYLKYLNDHDQEIPSPFEFKEIVKSKIYNDEVVRKTDFFGFVEQFIRDSETRINPDTGQTISYRTIQKYKTVQRVLKEFSSKYKGQIDFHTIDLSFYKEFNKYLQGMDFSTNNIGKYIETLKTFLNFARDLGYNVHHDSRSLRFRVPEEESESIYLNEEELDLIYQLDLSKILRLERVRDIFIIGCWTGLRISDYDQINKRNIIEGMFHITTYKTKEKIVIPLHPIVPMIMEKYNWEMPGILSFQKLNDYLKEIGELAGIKETFEKNITKGGVRKSFPKPKYKYISSHVARRSFATNLYKSGFPSISIMKITGHKTEKAFLKYIKVTPKEHAKLLADHWKNLLLKKTKKKNKKKKDKKKRKSTN